MNARREETSPARSGGGAVATALRRIAERARTDSKLRFTSLYHLLNEEMLRDCFRGLNGRSAAGIDQVTKAEYAEHLDERLPELVGELQRMAYRPHPVRRVHIPKPGTGKLRPLGIVCLEDKLVQAGVVRILEAIYEQDFIETSYGFRPGRSCHDALRELSKTIENRAINYVVEADIRGFFDAVDRGWLRRMLAERIGDERVLRMIERFLKAGVMEEGRHHVPEKGTIQGGVISPILANAYLHYTLDLWFERVFRKGCAGIAQLIRVADDFVVCFQQREDAERFEKALIERLRKFGLEVEPSKTKMLAFGARAAQEAKVSGGKPETFDFLGFTHYCGKTKDGRRFRVRRTTAAKKFRAKVAAVKEKLKRARTKPTKEIVAGVAATLRGHYAYYGVTDNRLAIGRFGLVVRGLLKKWLGRRGKRGSMSEEKFAQMLTRHPLPRPRITVNLYAMK